MNGTAAKGGRPTQSRPVPLSERLAFREMEQADFADLSAMFADPQARRFYPQMADGAHVQGWIDWTRQNYARDGFGLWVLTCAETGAFIGDCGLTHQKVGDGVELEIGYHVTERHRRRGYAIKAARAVLAFAFERTDAPLVCSKVAPDNAASRGVAARLHHHCARYRTDGGAPRLLFYTLRPWAERVRADRLVSG